MSTKPTMRFIDGIGGDSHDFRLLRRFGQLEGCRASMSTAVASRTAACGDVRVAQGASAIFPHVTVRWRRHTLSGPSPRLGYGPAVRRLQDGSLTRSCITSKWSRRAHESVRDAAAARGSFGALAGREARFPKGSLTSLI
jgi:hypothetical protein